MRTVQTHLVPVVAVWTTPALYFFGKSGENLRRKMSGFMTPGNFRLMASFISSFMRPRRIKTDGVSGPLRNAVVPNMSAISATDYEFIRQLVYDHSRINLGHDKVELVSSRLRKRLRTLNFNDFPPYLDFLRSSAGEEEVTDLLDVISTNVTDFFREPAHFQFMETIAMPEWLRAKGRKPGDRFRVWSAACSSGEEPYTLAITLAEYARENPGFDWEITASDLSTRMLDRAAEAVYRLERVQLPKPEWLRRYFQRGTGKFDGQARVKSELRQKITFAHQNLMEPYPFSQKFDLTFCRNVMIYFDRPTQESLVPRLRAQLDANGYLFVGHSESLIGIDKALKIVRPSIYRHV